MKAITQKPATKGQIRQIETVCKDALAMALEELDPTKIGAQRALESDEFADAMRNAARVTLSSLLVTDKYADEEVTSNYGYQPKPLAEQVTRLKELYPQLKDVEVPEQGELPAGAEGWFAIPNVYRPEPVLSVTDNDHIAGVLRLINQDRDGNFDNYREGQLGADRLRQSARSEATWKKINEDQGHPDILVIAAQFGLQHRGRSVRRAREVMVNQNQFGLGAFVVGIMLLTHPDRLKHYDDLWIDCAGDEFDDPDAVVRFDLAPYFGFDGDEIRFNVFWSGDANAYCGSVSCVLPQ